jgi:hypothetical protein
MGATGTIIGGGKINENGSIVGPLPDNEVILESSK